MRGYDPKNNKFFPTNRKDALKLQKAWAYDIDSYRYNLIELRKYYGNEISDFTIRKLPYRKNKHDPCRLLVIEVCGALFAKRHANNNYFSLDI